jgi:DegV family protein with EDD domain
VVGTTAAEMLDLFLASLKEDRELLGITTSRKIIRTYDAARSAARTLLEQPRYATARVEIVDSMTTDLGAALTCIAAGEARLAGWTLDETTELASAVAASALTVLYIQDLNRFVRGGRAGSVRAWLANKLGLRPLLGFLDGEIAAIGTVRGTEDPSALLVDAAVRRFGEKRSVWIAVSHGLAPDKAALCVAACRRRFDVRFALIRPLASSIYLHLGRDAVGLFVVPIDGMPRTPPTPPRLDDD